MEGNKPKIVADYGTVKAKIWENEKEKDGQKFIIQSIQLEKSYKDSKGEWVNNSITLNTNDVPKVIYALEDVFRKIYIK